MSSFDDEDPKLGKSSSDHASGDGSEPPKRADAASPASVDKVGPGNPPRQYRIKPGEIRNPYGRRGKPARSLTGLQQSVDTLRTLEKPVTVRLGDRVVKISRNEAMLEQQFALAMKGHGPSQRFLIKERRLALEEMRRHFRQIDVVEQWEITAAADPNRGRDRRAEAELAHFQQQTMELIGLGSGKRSHCTKLLEQEYRAFVARKRERAALGIRPATIAVGLEDRISIADPAKPPPVGDAIVVPATSHARLQVALRGRGKLTVEDLSIGLRLGEPSYEELKALLDKCEVPYEFERGAPPEDEFV